eukprot:3776839-Ditylum_brightwellii.AAC.1
MKPTSISADDSYLLSNPKDVNELIGWMARDKCKQNLDAKYEKANIEKEVYVCSCLNRVFSAQALCDVCAITAPQALFSSMPKAHSAPELCCIVAPQALPCSTIKLLPKEEFHISQSSTTGDFPLLC